MPRFEIVNVPSSRSLRRQLVLARTVDDLAARLRDLGK